ncbi:MAG: c-type cytochrome [Hyphomicrobiales bacterium]
MSKRIIILIVIGVAAFVVARAFQAVDEPVGTGAALAEVIVPELTGVAADGEIAFKNNCAACHGENAAGQDGVAPPLVHIIYEPNHHGDMSFVVAVKRGVRQHHWPFGNMAPVEGVNDDEITSIIAYVRTLQRANGIQ